MWTPEVNQPYIFIRRNQDQVEATVFTLYSDGSCGFSVESPEMGEGTFIAHTYEFNPDAWKKALKDLEKLGFVELEQAVSQKLLPANWQPNRKIRLQIEAQERLLSPRERPEWLSDSGEINELGLYRELKSEGRKEQQIYKFMKLKCSMDYKRFKAIVNSEQQRDH
ncbi:hypothetical protein Pan153_00540 [Gimesia panareensis]|uniref:Uncharacterized protein n=1 Tax=Gimesia panareensis TaxID=2527978 RepID=A0A518FGL3_9PLAN|nr:hypothetical protein [Gimesia panareensis]QDV15440.1 hypothetical protein Pan153_00540 [Gimesia panareensis]